MTMKFNEKLAEKPNHGHYAACDLRMTGIEQFSRNAAYYSISTAAFMAVFALFGMRFTVIGWIPSLFGECYEVGYMFVQFLELVGIAFCGFMGTHKASKYHIVLLAVYALMTVFPVLIQIFSDESYEITFIIGICGVVMMRDTFRNISDYEQLKNTEGFPQFSMIIADADDNPGYTSRYLAEYSRQSEESNDGRTMHELETISAPDIIPDEPDFIPESSDDNDMFDPL